MNTFKQLCVELRKKDYTLREIIRATGRPKSSVHFHIQSLPLSSGKLQAIREANRIRILEIVANKRRRGARAFRRFTRWNQNTVFLVSHFLFDGEIRHGGCVYNNRSAALIKRVEGGMNLIYDMQPKLNKNESTGVFRISYHNVVLSAYIRQKATQLLENVARFPRDLKREFLRSFFDDEGCMDFRPTENIRRVRGYQKNIDILYLIAQLLGDFGISAKIRRPNEIVITGKGNLLKFRKEIDFSPGVRINGRRSNSIWKKSLQKKELLRRAIASFVN